MMDDSQILSTIRAENNNTIGTSDNESELGKQRPHAIDYYHGQMDDLPPLPGWSKVTSRDVFKTIESAMPDLLEVFSSNEDVMEFLPEDEDDVRRAQQETDVVNYVFYQQNTGFLILYTFIKDALQTKNGFVKTWWEDREVDEEELYFDIDDETLAVLELDDDVEIVEDETTREKTGEFLPEIIIENPDGSTTTTPEEEIILIKHDVTTKRSKDVSGVKVQAIPPEEVAISRTAIDIQDAPLVRHEPKNVARSTLIEMGLDSEKVEQLRTVDRIDEQEEIARDTLNQDEFQSATINKAMQNVDVADNYIRLDMRENGKSELWHVMTGNDDTILLSKTRIVRVPISTMTPIIEPHKLFGLSLADLVLDLQRIKTFLTRAALDNAAALNNQRPIISETALADSTIDDVLTNRPSAPILVRGDARAALSYAPNNNISGDMLSLVEYFDFVQAERTGIRRFGQDMDANALQKDKTATEFAGQRADALKAIKLIARIFAETGLKDMMINIHHELQSHSGNKERAFRLNGTFETVNPREWKTRTDMKVNIGLGTGTKAEQTAQLLGILQEQKEAWEQQGRQNGPLVNLQQIRHTLARITELQGFKTADDFWNIVGPEDGEREDEAPRPDAAVLKVQADAQNDAEKNQIEREKNIVNAQIEQNDNDLDRQVKIFQIVQEILLKKEGQDAEIELKNDVAAFQAILEREKLDLEKVTRGVGLGIGAAKDLNDISVDITRVVEVGGDAG